jgi:hypothetical protein
MGNFEFRQHAFGLACPDSYRDWLHLFPARLRQSGGDQAKRWKRKLNERQGNFTLDISMVLFCPRILRDFFGKLGVFQGSSRTIPEEVPNKALVKSINSHA